MKWQKTQNNQPHKAMNNIINIENKKGKLKLNDSVHKDSADQLIKELEQLYGDSAVASSMQIGEITCSAENALESVDVEINTKGGSVFEGQRIYNALKGISARGVQVVTTVSGLAASMGSVILQAGDVRRITNGSRVMIHEAAMTTRGDARQLGKDAQFLEMVSSEIADIYAERVNGSAEEVRELMRDETWMDANQAKEAGFVDTIIKNGKESGTDNELNSQQSTTPENIMFTKDKDLQAKLEATQAEVTEHEATIVKREAEAVTLSEDLSTAKAELVENQTKITDLEAKLKTSDSEAKEAKDSQVKAESDLKEVEAKHDEKVIEGIRTGIAALGHNEPLNQNDGDGKPENLTGLQRAIVAHEKPRK
jgi:ATP-dependent Clp endopeptidase proteolytic subunit ClpP